MTSTSLLIDVDYDEREVRRGVRLATVQKLQVRGRIPSN